MSVPSARWEVVLSGLALQDFEAILTWTGERFGAQQVDSYRATIVAALRRLEAGPMILGTVARDDIGPGRRTIHVNRTGGRGRHVILFETREPRILDVLRILHDAMDLGRHIPPSGMAEEAAEMLP